MHLPFVPCNFSLQAIWIFGFSEIETFAFCFLSVCGVFPPFPLIFALTHFQSARGFLGRLDACFHVDLRVLALWLTGMLALLPGLLLACLA
jgi:hypothetical protein